MTPRIDTPAALVPAFSPALEAAIETRLVARLGHAASDEERDVYRQVLWAFASAIRAARRTPGFPPPRCPASLSTPGSPLKATTDKS
jgi:hypothetical protein